jgi:hypothetical protein
MTENLSNPEVKYEENDEGVELAKSNYGVYLNQDPE